MHKFYAMMVALVVTLFTTASFAWTPPASPAPASWISDTSGVLSADAHTRLDTKLKAINQSSANEIAALVLQTLDGQDIADVTNATFKAWGVGKKGLDNGVLVVLAIKDRKMRIETGKGVEGDLPDLKTQDIQVNVMRPRLKTGDVEGALGAGFDAIASSIANHRADVAAGKTSSRQSPSCQISNPGSDSTGGWILLFVAGGTITLVWYLARQAKRRREREEVQRLAALERQAARRRQIEEREAARQIDERARKVALNKPTPVVQVPTFPRPTPRPKPPIPRPVTTHPVTTVAVPVAAATVAAAAAEESRRKRAAQDAEDRRRRDRDDEDRRRRDSESSYSSSSSSSSYDSGGSSGGFGGGDSGGGGSPSDW